MSFWEQRGRCQVPRTNMPHDRGCSLYSSISQWQTAIHVSIPFVRRRRPACPLSHSAADAPFPRLETRGKTPCRDTPCRTCRRPRYSWTKWSHPREHHWRCDSPIDFLSDVGWQMVVFNGFGGCLEDASGTSFDWKQVGDVHNC